MAGARRQSQVSGHKLQVANGEMAEEIATKRSSVDLYN